jgi:protein phosphatase 1 regulatory subunit 10
MVKKEAKPVVTAVKDAKSDSSFFSAPKPKPKLPSFKKAPAPTTHIKKELDPNVAQPSSIDPFQEALKSMAKARKESPAVSTPPPTSASTPPQTTGLTKLGKKKKSVTWAPEGQLQSIRLIEKAIYDDDPVDVSHLFLFVVFVLYINCFVRLAILHRVYILHTAYVIWIVAKELHCMPIYSKKP